MLRQRKGGGRRRHLCSLVLAAAVSSSAENRDPWNLLYTVLQFSPPPICVFARLDAVQDTLYLRWMKPPNSQTLKR